MRLAEFMILLCLLSLASLCSDAVATRTVFFMTDADGAKKRSSNETFEAKRLHFHSEQCSNSEKYNHSSVDDKRVVPTGSNPLHNK
ncbi:hypothetical protein I3760_08G030800 [Carya illinoinensis]|nr:hypothetical protein I3760_08G030800 [Carya illinoinensis]